jgi:glycosyltransferase involved in cell wall biosynthesis
MTTVSVVIPTRNRSDLLATTLRTVLWQRGVELEVVVVEDASTDDTAEMVRGLGDPRITLVRREAPRGPSTARNEGAARAGGAWLAFVDDDDLWAPDKLAAQVAAAEQAGRDWAYVGSVNVGDALEVVSGEPPPGPEEVAAGVPRYNAVPGGGSNVTLRRALFDEVGGFDERFPPCEDWELWIRLARAGLPAAVSRPLMGYRLHGGSSSLDTERILRSARLIEEVHATRVDWGRLHRWLGESALRMDRRPQALAHLAKAAMRGEGAGVASDVLAILRRRIARAGLGAPPDPGDGGAWMAEASEWLGELRAPTASADGAPDPP